MPTVIGKLLAETRRRPIMDVRVRDTCVVAFASLLFMGYTEGKREKANDCEDRYSGNNAMPDFHVILQSLVGSRAKFCSLLLTRYSGTFAA